MDLTFIERVVRGGFHRAGSGRPPRNPLGLFKANIVKRMRRIPSDRELVRRLWRDEELRRICDIEANEKPYGIAVLSRFRKRIGPERLRRITDHLVKQLIKTGALDARTVALDTSPIKAYSRRSMDNRSGYSDPEARVGRAVRGYQLGYKAHIALDARKELPVAFTAAPMNINEKKIAPTIIRRVRRLVKNRAKTLVADKEYSSEKLRQLAINQHMEPVIPYPENHHKGEKGLLRVDKKFRTHGPTRLKRIYAYRTAAERVNSRLKEQLNLANHKLKGLRNITIHIAYCIITMLLTAIHAIRIGKPWKTRSITNFTA